MLAIQLTMILKKRTKSNGRRAWAMYVCICNALKDKDVDRAIAAGARTVFDVYTFHGCEPQCGRCMPTMQVRLGANVPVNDSCPLLDDDDLLAAE